MRCLYLSFSTCLVLGLLVGGGTRAAERPDSGLTRIGVLAHRGSEQCLKQWLPTAAYLSQRLPDTRCEIVPLDFERIADVVGAGAVDFVLANPSVSLGLAFRFGILPIATLVSRGAHGHASSQFGGVLFCLASRDDIRSVQDIKGRTLAAVDPASLGGWQAVWYELLQAGIDPHHDLRELRFGGTHDAVVEAVLARQVDFGTVRSGVIEYLQDGGKLPPDSLRVLRIGPAVAPAFPYVCSTRLYPEWPLAKLAHTPDSLAVAVSVALLQMAPGDPAAAAAGAASRTVPLEYAPVGECLKQLRLPPYEDYGRLTWQSVWAQYRGWICATGGLLLAAIALCVLLARLSRRRTTALLRARESEQKARLIVDNLGIGVALLDRDLRVLEVNEGLATWFPQSVQATGRPCRQVFGRDDERDCQDCPVRPALADGARHEKVISVTAAGETRRLKVVAAPVRDDAGRTTGVIETFEDVTERLRMQDALRASEEHFRLLFESSRDAIMTLEPPTWGFTSGNPACVAVFGARDEAHFTSLGPADVSPELQPDGRASGKKAREMIETAMREGSCFFDWTHRRLGGEDFPATVLLTRVEIGGNAFLQATVRDITAQKEEQLARRVAEERFRAMSTSAQDAMIMVGPTGRITFWNRAATVIFGWSEEEAVGQDLHALLAPERFHQAAYAGFGTFQQAGMGGAIGKTLELAAKRRDGSEFPMEIALAALQIGREWHAVGIIRDITARKQSETALIEATAKAEDASRAKSEFLANMSHEIRTPMNGIIGMTELALDTTLTQEQRHYLETVQSSAVTLLTLLNDILDFSKIEAGKLELEEVGFQIREVLGDALRMESLRADRKGLELALAVDPAVPEHVVGDPLRLRQVVVNLVGNAVKFTEKGEIVVRVTAPESAGDVVELDVSVGDTGVGIPADKQAAVFQAFTQADGSTTRRFGGTGLGLTISRQLVKMMGGTLSVESPNPAARTGGPGSVFSFRARLRRQAGGETVACRLVPEQLAGLKILVVDDNETNREILTQMLGNWKAVAVTADSTLSAVVALERAAQQREPFRLILLDCNMPGGDGFSLMEHLRTDPSYSDLPVIMLSSGPRPGDIEKRKRLGIKGFLLKPLKQSELLDAVLLCLGTLVMEQARRYRKESPAKDVAAAAPGGGGGARAARSLRVLVAEDNAVNQELAVHALAKQGHQATVVGTGKAAVELLQREAFDLVLMDVQMPEMDGLTATRTIREPTSAVLNHDIVVIAMTAHAMTGDRERCLEAGMSGYISKPVTQKQLAAVIQDVMGGASPAAQTPVGGPAGPGEADLLKGFDGDASFLAHVARLFLKDCDPLLAAVRNAIAANDHEALRIAAHTLKGMVAVFGYKPAQEAALRLELMGREQNLAEAAAAGADLEVEVGVLRDSLQKVVADSLVPGSPSAS